MTPQLDASVVICAYTMDRWDDLTAAVEAVQHQTHPSREIIVVVDRTETLLERATAELEGVTVALNHHGPGLSGARNTGYDLSSAAVIVFLDDDAFPEPQWLAELLAAYEDPSVLGAGGEVVPLWREGRPAWFPAEFNWVVGCSYTGMPEQRSEIRNPIGANLSMRREVFGASGGFELALGRLDLGNGKVVTGTADETEFCIRARRENPGGRWLYVPEARVHHVVARSRGTWRYFAERCRLEGGSKAVLTGLTGTEKGLESERRYVRSVLPRAVVRDVTAGLRGDRVAFQRAAAIVVGLVLTAGAYVRGRVAMARGRRARYAT
jgi:glycosyltransferase involved in cell wall biosynthesis